MAKVEWHPGELYLRVRFIVTNLSRPAERIVAFYNGRGTAEQWIKEGKNAAKWTRLSCQSFAANAVRPQLHALAYHLANFLGTLAPAGRHREMVADQPEGKARREACRPRALHDLPDGGGRRAARSIPAHSSDDRRASTTANSAMLTHTALPHVPINGRAAFDDALNGAKSGLPVAKPWIGP